MLQSGEANLLTKSLSLAQSGDEATRQRLRPILAAANINPDSFLATDYLNHFNEAVMLLEIVPEDPTLLDDLRTWSPKSYQQHFHDSQFENRDLACTAYEIAPSDFRIPFDLVIRTIDRRISRTIKDIETRLSSEQPNLTLAGYVNESCSAIGKLILTAGAIINGQRVRSRGEAEQTPIIEVAVETATTMAQSDIDALFD